MTGFGMRAFTGAETSCSKTSGRAPTSQRGLSISRSGRMLSGDLGRSSVAASKCITRCCSLGNRGSEEKGRDEARLGHNVDANLEWKMAMQEPRFRQIEAELSSASSMSAMQRSASLPADLTLESLAAANAAAKRYDVTPFIKKLKLTSKPTEDRVLLTSLKQVWVILFGVGENEAEGIYSLRKLNNEDINGPKDTIIAFESEEDAVRYAGLLEASMEHFPRVTPIEPTLLLEFCVDSNYKCRLETQGSLLMPPDYNIGLTDWERFVRLKKGHYNVLEKEPQHDLSYQSANLPDLSSLNWIEERRRLERAWLK